MPGRCAGDVARAFDADRGGAGALGNNANAGKDVAIAFNLHRTARMGINAAIMSDDGACAFHIHQSRAGCPCGNAVGAERCQGAGAGDCNGARRGFRVNSAQLRVDGASAGDADGSGLIGHRQDAKAAAGDALSGIANGHARAAESANAGSKVCCMDLVGAGVGVDSDRSAVIVEPDASGTGCRRYIRGQAVHDEHRNRRGFGNARR